MKDIDRNPQQCAGAVLKARIRPAEPEDCAEIARMVRALAAFNKDHSEVDRLQILDAGFGPAAWAQLFVAEQGVRLVGYAAMTMAGQLQFCRRSADVHHLYIAPDVRGQAIARLLVAALRDSALAQGAEALTIGTAHSNWRARTAYLKMGFVQVPRQGVKLRLGMDNDRQ